MLNFCASIQDQGHAERYADHHRQPHGQDLRNPHRGWGPPGAGPPSDQDFAGRFRADDLRSGVYQYRLLQELHHLHRRRQGHPELPRLSHRAAGGEEQLPGSGLPDPERRASQPGGVRGVGASNHHSHPPPREHQEIHGRVLARCPPYGDAGLHGGSALHLLPGRQRHHQRRVPAVAVGAPHRQDAHPGRLRLPVQHRASLRLSR